MFFDGNYDKKNKKIIIFLNVHLIFSSWPKGLKDPSVRGPTFPWLEEYGTVQIYSYYNPLLTPIFMTFSSW